MTTRPLLHIVLLLGILSTPKAAGAGVLARTSSGGPVRWTKSEIVLTVTPPTLRTGIEANELLRVLEKASTNWNRILERHRAPRLRVELGQESVVRQDNKSVVVLQALRWCPHDAATDDDCHDKRRTAITHLYPVDVRGSNRDGEVDEVDVEVNAVNFDWARDDGDHQRLYAVLVHELGHVLGLDHPCVPFPVARSLGPGLPVLRPCIEPASKLSIMYPDPIEQGRPLVLTPAEDDANTLAAIYPRTRSCVCGIDRDGHRSYATVPFAIAALGALVARRRRSSA